MHLNQTEGKNNIFTRETIVAFCRARRAEGKRLVFTNGCFDLLHAGHVDLLEQARAQGDVLIVGLNSDASVRRLKGPSRPVNAEEARAKVLLALRAVDAVAIFEEDTPVEILDIIQPDIHVKGGDYVADALPEAATVRRHGGEIVIVPLVEGFSTTALLAKSNAPALQSVLVIPARYGSTRFPGKPLAQLNGEAVIVHVVRAGLQTQVRRPVLVATDNDAIAEAIKSTFEASEAIVVMTDSDCKTGTERVAQAVQRHFSDTNLASLLILNVQGDEPFINPAHLDALLDAMHSDAECWMGTLAAPLPAAALDDPNVVKVVVDLKGRALYFSRYGIPLQREVGAKSTFERLRHVGVYAYRGDWLLQMAALPPAPLEEMEMLEQLRALENGVSIQVARVDGVVPIAIDTPHDLEQAQRYLDGQRDGTS